MKVRLLILSAVILLASCKPANPSGFAGYADAVTISPTSNSLRFKVEVNFTRKCNWCIQYWEVSKGRESARHTAFRHTDAGTDSQVLKFLYPDTEYEFCISLLDKWSEPMRFKTGSLPADCPVYRVEKDGDTGLKGFLMQWEASPSGYVTFSDIDGKVVWYEAFGEEIRVAWCDPAMNRLAVLTGFKEGDDKAFQRLCAHTVVTDLDGNRLLYWTSGKGNIEYPHHEIKILPDGNLLYVNNVVKTFPIGDVYGDGFTVISPEGNTVRQWDCFAELGDLSAEYLNAAKRVNDLIHANSVAVDSEGNWYMTFNAISELWKIDGTSGKVLYRFGVNGNVTLQEGDFPTGGLHAATVLAPDRILCYSNGRDIQRSSAIVINVDPLSKTARYDLTITLPAEYSSRDRSNAQLLAEEGRMLLSSTTSRKAVFTDLEGNILRVISREGISYRSYWFNDFEYQ